MRVLNSCVLLLTVPANGVVAPVHHRMPLIVPRLRWDRWLDPATAPMEAEAMIVPAEEGELVAWPVSRAVSTVANEGPELVEPSSERQRSLWEEP